MQDWGFTDFKFDWLVNSEMSVVYLSYCGTLAVLLVPVMAMFLAELRGIDSSIVKRHKLMEQAYPLSLSQNHFTLLAPVVQLR